MKIHPTEIPNVVVLEPKVFEDQRGFFMEIYRKSLFRELGVDVDFVQDNHSRSVKNTLRGLHYQIHNPQGKLVRVIRGEVFDVAVDLRRASPTFGRWVGVTLSEQNRLQLYVPPGLAHGFCVTSDVAEFAYKCSDYWHPEHERTLLWNDPHVGVKWPTCEPILSEKDRRGLPWSEIPVYETS
jgi:dTDP-4-dehydrorhamnose 3,5-epimerase